MGASFRDQGIKVKGHTNRAVENTSILPRNSRLRKPVSSSYKANPRTTRALAVLTVGNGMWIIGNYPDFQGFLTTKSSVERTGIGFLRGGANFQSGAILTRCGQPPFGLHPSLIVDGAGSASDQTLTKR